MLKIFLGPWACANPVAQRHAHKGKSRTRSNNRLFFFVMALSVVGEMARGKYVDMAAIKG